MCLRQGMPAHLPWGLLGCSSRLMTKPCSAPAENNPSSYLAARGERPCSYSMRTDCTPQRPLSLQMLRPFLNPGKFCPIIGSGICLGTKLSHPICAETIKSTSGTIVATSIVPEQVFLPALTHWTYTKTELCATQITFYVGGHLYIGTLQILNRRFCISKLYGCLHLRGPYAMLGTDGRGRSPKYISWAMHHRPWGTEAKKKTKLASETSKTIMAKEHGFWSNSNTS